MFQSFKGAVDGLSSLLPFSHNDSTTTAHPNVENEGKTSEGAGRQKRGAETALDSSEQPEPKRRQLYPGRKNHESKLELERRLMGAFDTSKDAIPISLPIGDGDVNDKIPAAEKSAYVAMKNTRPGGGIVRPRNTLNESRYGVGSLQNTPGFQSSKDGRPRATPARSLDLTSDHERGRDGFDQRESQPPNKKQKLDVRPSLPPRGMQPNASIIIDDDHDGRQAMVQTTISELNGKPISQGVPLSQRVPPRQSSPAEPFTYNEHKKVNENTRLNGKRSRKQNDRRPSDPASSRGTPATSHGSVVSVTVVDDNVMDEHEHQQPLRRNSHVNGEEATIEKQSKSKPPIDLTKDYDQRPKSKMGPLEEQIAGINHVHDTSSKNPFGSARTAESMENTKRQRPRRNISQSPAPEPTASTRQSPHRNKELRTSPPLSKKFQREEQSSTKARPPARNEDKCTPQLSSRAGPIDDGSPDELASGGNTVGRRIKAVSDSSGQRDLRAGADGVFQSDATPPQSKAKKRALTKNQVSIRAFYTASCVLNSGDIRLHYIPEEEHIYVLQDEEMIRLSGDKSRVIAIGDQEVDKAYWDKTREVFKFCLSGPRGHISQGFICIVFECWDDLEFIMDSLFELKHERMKFQPLEPTQLNKTFDNLHDKIIFAKNLRQNQAQADDARSAAKIQGRNRQPSRDDSESQATTQGPRQRVRSTMQALHRDDDEEQIIYENDEPPTTRSREGRSSQSAYHQSQYFVDQPRRSSRATAPTRRARSPTPPRKWTQVNKPTPWPNSVVYPTVGAKRVTVDFQDLERLDEDEFLNDNVVGFAIRQIEENMSVRERQDVLFFNTFFYTALSTKDGKKAFNYDAVKRWTKNSDLMSKRYIVVPINLHLHWFVAIICNPDKIQRKASTLEDFEADEKQEAVVVNEDTQDDVVEIEPEKADLPQSTEAMESLALSDLDKNFQTIPDDADEEDGKSPLKKRKSKKRKAPGLMHYHPDTPIIITLDSLGSQHTVESRFLKDYICCEARERRGMDVKRDEIQAMTAKGIPQQVNFSDCGVYVVGYLEQFAKDPQAFVKSVLSREINKVAGFASFDPSVKREQIRNDLLALQKEQHEAKLEAKRVTKKTTPTEQPKAADSNQPATKETAPAATPLSWAFKPTTEEARTTKEAAATPVTASISADIVEDEDQELETAVPRALGQRVSQAPETTHIPAAPGPTRHEDEEILEPQGNWENSFETDLMRYAGPHAERPPAEVPESQEVG